ncbi:MAG TPA: DNA-directed DNA polymerase [archaeon]|nr:DNA-directed DNA polymerase [archaeon]
MFKIFKKQEEKKDCKISKNAIFLDSFYKDNQLFVVLKTEKKEIYPVDFYPYFYLFSQESLTNEEITRLNIKDIEKKEKINKLIFNTVEDLVKTRNELLTSDFLPGKNYKLYEYDIPFVSRFFLDKNLSNFCEVECTIENQKIIDIKPTTKEKPKIKYCAFDIEVLVSKTLKFPEPGKDPIISISYFDSDKTSAVFFLAGEEVNLTEKQGELITKFSNVHLFKSEREMIESFMEFIKEKEPDVVYTYNGIFDFDYLKKAYNFITGKEFTFGNSHLIYPKGKNKRVNLEGIVHIDVYAIMKLLRYLQVFNYPKLDLNTLYSKLTGKKKLSLPPLDMREAYLSGDYAKIIEYNLDDVYATQELAENYNQIVFEISEFINYPVSDLIFSSAGVMVERLFTKYYFNNKKIIPNKPTQETIGERQKFSFSGAFVKAPISGLHQNLAVLDFRSYHISLIISYNLSPETVDCPCCKEEPFVVLGSHYTCKKKGFVPTLLEELLALRSKYKEEAKTLPKESTEYREMYAKQYALKIFLASTYGYMGFAGARWYSRPTLEIMYSLVRSKIQETIKDLENLGYRVVYGDTDSCFIEFRNIEKLKEDLKNLNASLPKAMTLELEDIYQSGIFVQSRDKDRAAKKKYALLDYNGNLKIKGFEYVRHDWCPLVKETQKEILKIILKEKDPKKALKFLQLVISDLQKKEIPNSKLIIQTFVHKSLESYKTLNPAMSAVKNAKDKGKKFKVGDLVEYIVTEKAGKTISEKSQIAEFVKEKDYDSEYYINNQLIPALLPIMEEIGVTKDELITNTKQKGLGEFF